MTALDRLLQAWRIAKAGRFLAPGMRVLDVGSGDGALFKRVKGLDAGSVGIDPTLRQPVFTRSFQLVPGIFPKDMPAAMGLFDAITMLAVLEHVPDQAHAELAVACRDYLKLGGRIIITVPAAAVDRILAVLKGLRLIDGMSLEEHHGYDVKQTEQIFRAPDFTRVSHRRFQLGLNNLFVFARGQGSGG